MLPRTGPNEKKKKKKKEKKEDYASKQNMDSCEENVSANLHGDVSCEGVS